MNTRAIPDHRSMRDYGPYSAYCKVCWNAIYTLWVDTVPPPGTCMFGHTKASDCPDALGRAETTRRIQEARARARQLASAQQTTEKSHP